MKYNVIRAMAISCAVAILPVSAASAQKITDQHVQDLIRAAAERAGVAAQSGATSPHAPGAADGPPSVGLSLDEAIKLALDRNLDIAVQRLNPETFDYSIAGLKAVYKPTLTSAVSQQSQTNPSTQTTSGGQVGTGILQDTTTFNAGLSQSLPWGGGTF